MSTDRLTQLLHELDDLDVALPAPDPVRARGRALRRRRQAAAAGAGVGLAVAGVAAALALTGGTTQTLEQLPPAQQPVAPSVQPSAVPSASSDAQTTPDGGATEAPQPTGGAQATGEPQGTPVAPPPTPVASAPATPAAEPSTGGDDLVADGVDTARIVGFADRDGGIVVTTNRVQLLTGEAANAYAAARGWEVPVPNDQLLVDDNPRLREYPVRPDAAVSLTIPLSPAPTGEPVETTLPALRALLAERPDGDAFPFELVVEDGVVVALRMLYQP